MALQAGFSEIDITPPIGVEKIGWLKVIVSDEVLSPLFARVAIFRSAQTQIAFVQLDTLFIAWDEVVTIRSGVESEYDFPGGQVMISATHNHAGPAVAQAGDVQKNDAYAQFLVSQVIIAFGEALANLVEVEVGYGHTCEWNVAHNRRVVLRDGTVRTHGTFDDPLSLYLEGPVDPQVAVLAARSKRGEILGILVNFACHPTHHGGDTMIDAGYPGVLAEKLRQAGCPLTLFLNGSSGNLHTADPKFGGRDQSAEEVGEILARDVSGVLEGLNYSDAVDLRACSKIIELPYRQVTDAEIQGKVHGAQRFIDPAIYDRAMSELTAKITRRNGILPVEIQALSLGEVIFIGVPGELFVEFGLQIKQHAYPLQAIVVSCANGRLGYIPTEEAFTRGGYETTFGPGSQLAPEAGELIVKTAVDLINTCR